MTHRLSQAQWNTQHPIQDFPGLQSHHYEHPDDRRLLSTARNIKGFDTVFKALSGAMFERQGYLMDLANHIRVGPVQHPQLYRVFQETVRALDIPEPELFISNRPGINAYATGSNKPYVVLHADLLHVMSSREIQWVIAHELGHIKSGHVLYQSMMQVLTSGAINLIPGIGILFQQGLQQALLLGLMHWSRVAEFTADRAAALVTGSPELGVQTLLKLAGGWVDPDHFNLDAFMKQGEEFSSISDTFSGKVYNLMSGVLEMTHPYPVIRAKALQEWHQSSTYQGLVRQEHLQGLDQHYRLYPHPGARCEKCSAFVADQHAQCPNCQHPRTSQTLHMSLPDEIKCTCHRCQKTNSRYQVYCFHCGEKIQDHLFKTVKPQESTEVTREAGSVTPRTSKAQYSTSKLTGGLGNLVNQSLKGNEQILQEVETNMGIGLAFTTDRILVVKAGLVAAGGFGKTVQHSFYYDNIEELHLKRGKPMPKPGQDPNTIKELVVFAIHLKNKPLPQNLFVDLPLLEQSNVLTLLNDNPFGVLRTFLNQFQWKTAPQAEQTPATPEATPDLMMLLRMLDSGKISQEQFTLLSSKLQA
ncbi:M48 family metalloprotease [Deinococcus cellulosilyticus]|uniref:Peptidase M48 domain-containing protein n=1 Tax=Deinococcus cellulosilyticus (strain DSM 18568 / NBRC 106333 / KACC 11606 / 5516J-15) TaxID=1223518 RepID=A0A511N8K1_DEIC1|nr:M48 family metalloprotease [Deinococcus cellulosilyticus]GEM49164.1 hypothetical protein DC3_47990 [Deinococcus cellulosilyticus NBRC 106333 = KACC 11606]